MLGFREDAAFFGAMTRAFYILIQSSGVGQRGACCLPDGHLESPLAFNPTVSIPDSTHLPEKLQVQDFTQRREGNFGKFLPK